MRFAAAALALFATGALAQAQDCVDGLYIVVARGTGEEPGAGVTGLMAKEVAKQIKNSKVAGLDYPASFEDPAYDDSEGEGAVAMNKAIIDYHNNCPGHKMAIMGYSQGAQAVSDVICGGSGGNFDTMMAIKEDIIDETVTSIVLFGDPSHVAGLDFDRGTSTKDGVFSRNETSKCERFSDILVSYCDEGDVYCDSGEESSVHSSYFFGSYRKEVIKYMVNKYEAAVNGDSQSSTSASVTATSTVSTAETGSAMPTATLTISGAITSATSAVEVSGSTMAAPSTTAGSNPASESTAAPAGTDTPVPSPSVVEGAASGLSASLYLAVPAALLAVSHMLM